MQFLELQFKFSDLFFYWFETGKASLSIICACIITRGVGLKLGITKSGQRSESKVKGRKERMKSVVRAQTQMDLWEINYEKWRWQRMNLHMSSWRESGWIRKIHCVENTSMRENILIGWIVGARWWRRGCEEATAQRCRASLEMRRKRGRERPECPTDTIALLTSAHTFLAFLFISHINRHRIVSHIQILARILSDLLVFLLKKCIIDMRSQI